MASMNKVFLAGNLTRDPEVKYIASGQAVAKLGLAINEVYVTKTGEKKESVVFVDVDVWGRQAETAGQYLTKGSPILVEGSLVLDSWETPEGEKRSRLKIRGQRIQFLGSGGGKKEGGASPGPHPEKTPGAGTSSGGAPQSEHSMDNAPIQDDEIPF